MAERKRAGLFRYLKEAFLFRWNLLLLGGASAAAVMTGHADIALPLVAAAEVTYLAGLSTLPRYQAAIDAKASYEQRGLGGVKPALEAQGNARDRILEVLRSLTEERRSRFLRLRARCVEMARLATAVRGEHDATAAELRQPALDRLLWVFLKLLLSDQALDRFMKAADESTIDKKLTDMKARRQKRADSVPDAEEPGDRILKTLDDSIATVEVRKENIDKARENQELIAAELERLENKIHAVTEMAVGNSTPEEMSGRIDAISEGMDQTEATIRDLQSITGVRDEDETPPIVHVDLTPQRQGAR